MAKTPTKKAGKSSTKGKALSKKVNLTYQVKKQEHSDNELLDKPWLKRTRVNTMKLFDTPELLLEAADEYFEYTNKRRLYRTEFNGKDAIECHIPLSVPFTIHGFCLFTNSSPGWFRGFKYDMEQRLKRGRENNDRYDSDLKFAAVLQYIENTMYAQKFEGATSGIFKEGIISRDLGLTDKTETKMDVAVGPKQVFIINGKEIPFE